MRCLIILSLLLLLGCSHPYRHLHKATADPACLDRFRPAFGKAWYEVEVNVLGKSFSGLMLIKKMPDGSIRVSSTAKTGTKFFDFEFTGDTGFAVHYIMPQMNREALVKALRKDFDLLLFRVPDRQKPETLRNNDSLFYAFPAGKETDYYITDTACTRLLRIESASKGKRTETIWLSNDHERIPGSILISHKKFNFKISLNRLLPDVTE